MKVQIVTKNKDHEHKLILIVPYQIGMMEALRKEFKFTPPTSIILRPMKEVKRETVNLNLAWAGYTLEKGYYIALKMTLFRGGLLHVLDVLAHEVAHIAVCRKLRRWGHPPLHEEMYQFALEWVNKKVK